MTRQEFETKSFDELMEILNETRNDITTYEILKEFAKQKIDEDNLYVAVLILKLLHADPLEWYQYSYSVDMFEAPIGLSCKDDIKYLIDE